MCDGTLVHKEMFVEHKYFSTTERGFTIIFIIVRLWEDTLQCNNTLVPNRKRNGQNRNDTIQTKCQNQKKISDKRHRSLKILNR